VAPLLAAANARTGARIRRGRQTCTNSCRSCLIVVLDALRPLFPTGVVALLAAILAEFHSQQIPLRPDPGLLAVILALITAVCPASFALGTCLTPSSPPRWPSASPTPGSSSPGPWNPSGSGT
jgi:hypothetical protein